MKSQGSEGKRDKRRMFKCLSRPWRATRCLLIIAGMCGLSATWTHGVLAAANSQPRTVLSLDGSWQIAEGGMDKVPSSFDHTVPVPGLVSLAQPPFVEAG